MFKNWELQNVLLALAVAMFCLLIVFSVSIIQAEKAAEIDEQNNPVCEVEKKNFYTGGVSGNICTLRLDCSESELRIPCSTWDGVVVGDNFDRLNFIVVGG